MLFDLLTKLYFLTSFFGYFYFPCEKTVCQIRPHHVTNILNTPPNQCITCPTDVANQAIKSSQITTVKKFTK